MEGYEEFMQPLFLKAAELLQRDDGCYSSVESNFRGSRLKRTAKVLGDGCVDHTTGLGASVLSLFLKYYSQNKLY